MSETPAIRFEGFADPWEQRKLGEFDIKTGPFGSTLHAEDYVAHGTPIVTTEHFKNGDLPLTGDGIPQVSDGDLARLGQYQLQRHDIVFSRVGSVDLNAEVKDAQVGWLFSGRVLRVRPDESVDSTFLHYELSTDQVRNSIIERAVGLTMASINTGILGDTVFVAPIDIAEQVMIGSIFSSLDHLITLHQRKHDRLVVLKKALLDKMFPRDGSRFPELRFGGFTDPWEQRKLGDIAQIIGGGTPDTNNPAYWDGDIDWYSPAELGEQIYADASQRRITRLGYENSSAKMLPADKTILFTSRAGIGTTAILRRSACTNQGFQSLIVNDEINVYFVYSMSNRIKSYAESKASGSTFLEISAKLLGDMDIWLPSRSEQDAIGSYFQQLDNLITLHQRKLELLRNLKSACLDKMFV